jgi:hypothetical protein
MDCISRRKALQNLSRASQLAGVSLAAARTLPSSVYGNGKVTAFVLAGDRYHNID